MQRRKFLGRLGRGAVVLGAMAGSGCGADKQPAPTGGSDPASASFEPVKWKMVTTWPKNFPGLGTGANFLAELITRMSGGRIEVKVYGAGELVPAFEVFGAVAAGTAELGHGASYYWKGKSEAAQFFSAVPFGLTAEEMNAWLYHGGGLDLWTETYRPFGLVPLAAGNTGVQMAGWFNREINSLDDLQGLKMRIPGLGGEVLARAGGTPVSLPGGELFTALQSGAIDATEWVGPYNDLAFGLYKAARFYYYPGWHEPGTTLECIVNKAAFEALPEQLQVIVSNATRVANQDMYAEYIARNNQALQTLVQEHNVQLRKLPDPVLQRLRELSGQVVAEIAEHDPISKRVYESFQSFRQQAEQWSAISQRAYLDARSS